MLLHAFTIYLPRALWASAVSILSLAFSSKYLTFLTILMSHASPKYLTFSGFFFLLKKCWYLGTLCCRVHRELFKSFGLYSIFPIFAFVVNVVITNFGIAYLFSQLLTLHRTRFLSFFRQNVAFNVYQQFTLCFSMS